MFERIEKKRIIKIPEIIPVDMIKNKFLNEFYIKSKNPFTKGNIKNFKKGQKYALEILNNFFPKHVEDCTPVLCKDYKNSFVNYC